MIVGYILIRFLNELNKDNNDLDSQNLDQKFSGIVNILNYPLLTVKASLLLWIKENLISIRRGGIKLFIFSMEPALLPLLGNINIFKRK